MLALMSRLARGSAYTAGPKDPKINHITTINSLSWPKTPEQTKVVLSGRIFQELRDQLQGVGGKGQNSP